MLEERHQESLPPPLLDHATRWTECLQLMRTLLPWCLTLTAADPVPPLDCALTLMQRNGLPARNPFSPGCSVFSHQGGFGAEAGRRPGTDPVVEYRMVNGFVSLQGLCRLWTAPWRSSCSTIVAGPAACLERTMPLQSATRSSASGHSRRCPGGRLSLGGRV